MTKVLICGDRNWQDREYIYDRLDEMVPLYGISEVIEGCARGADRMAEWWAHERGLTIHHFPADWDKHGKAAGAIRNHQMLVTGQPYMVIAFHTNLQESRGTKHMVEIARAAGIQTFVFPHSHEGYRSA